MTAGWVEQYGALCACAAAKKRWLGAKAAACFVFTGWFLFFLYDFSAFSSGIGVVRAGMPLLIPLAAVGYGGKCLYNTGKRLEFYERGLVYHTPWFELDTPYREIASVSAAHENGREGARRIGQFSQTVNSPVPVTALRMTLADGRQWAFYSTTFAELDRHIPLLHKGIARAKKQAG